MPALRCWGRILTIGFGLLRCTINAHAQQVTVSGWLGVIWEEQAESSGPTLFLTEATGRTVRLELDASQRVALGPAAALAGRRATVVLASTLTYPQGFVPSSRVRSLQLGPLDPRARFSPSMAMGTAIGAVPFVTILCRYADVPAVPVSPAQVAVVQGTSYPGTADFFGELSAGAADLRGNTVVGWYTLPAPRSRYVQNNVVDVAGLAADCAAAADTDVYFPQFYGINIQVNGPLATRETAPFDPLSYGGSLQLSLDGGPRVYGVTWLADLHALNYTVVTHEMGHAFGWPHSSGPYQQTYDSQWDLMSVGYLFRDPAYGWLGAHTVAYHKDLSGWLPPSRVYLPPGPDSVVIDLVRTALPPPGGGYLMAKLPLAGTPGQFYTVETRRTAGYDRGLPADGVVIHKVDPTLGDRQAQVVDVDNNGNPNDAAAVWTPGERFTDLQDSVSVAVLSAIPAGYRVSIAYRFLAPTTLAVTPTSRRDSVVFGATGLRADSAAVLLSGTGSGTASWTATHSARAAWLSLTTVQGTGSGRVRWTRNPAGLAVGVYVDSLTVTATGAEGSPAQVIDSLVILPPPTLAVAPTSRRDSVEFGATGPRADSAAVFLTGAGGSTASWTTAHSARAAWLSLTTAHGTGSGRLRWTRNPAALAVGVYVDSLTVTVPGAAGSPALVVDSLVILAPTTLAITPTNRRDSVEFGATGPRADSAAVVVSGPGSGTASWTATHSARAAWLSLTTAQGTGSGRLRWARNPAGLAVGIYVDSLTVTVPGAAGSPARVVDSLWVGEPAVAITCATGELLAGPCLSPVQKTYLDQTGNDDGVYNAGDLLAYLDRKGLPLTSEALAALGARNPADAPIVRTRSRPSKRKAGAS